MRKVNVRQLEGHARQILLSLNRFLYVLKPLSESASLATAGLPVGCKIVAKVERPSAVHFEVLEQRDLLVETDESNKFVNFYRLSAVLAAGALPEPIRLHRSFKKVTDLRRAGFGEVEGLLVADKMGEIGFINAANVDKLPTPEETKEEQKQATLPEGELPPFEESEAYRTLYGHQETCLGLEVSADNRLVASCDTLKKVNVANWPNVFSLQSVLLEHTLPILSMCFLGSDKIASLSEGQQPSGEQDLLVSSAHDASLLHSRKVRGVSNLAQTKAGGLLLLKEDQSAQLLDGEAFSLAEGPTLSSEQSAFANQYLALQAGGQPSVRIFANFNQQTGSLDESGAALASDLIIQPL